MGSWTLTVPSTPFYAFAEAVDVAVAIGELDELAAADVEAAKATLKSLGARSAAPFLSGGASGNALQPTDDPLATYNGYSASVASHLAADPFQPIS